MIQSNDTDLGERLFSQLIFWNIAAVIFHIIFFVISWIVLFVAFDLEQHAVVAVLYYSSAMCMPLVFFYWIVFARGSIRIETKISIIFCAVVTVQLSYAAFYALLPCLDNGGDTMADALYFSFLSFSTLGYGDLVATVQCRPVAVTQSVYGLMTVAALVSIASTAARSGD